MTELSPATPLTALKGVGPSRAAALEAAGWQDLADLLAHLPYRYEDRRRRFRVDQVEGPGRYGLCGRLRDVKQVRVRRRRLTLVRARIEDESGSLSVLWFNRPYLAQQVDESREYFVYGDVRCRDRRAEMVNPSVERVEAGGTQGGIVPFYPSIPGLSGALLRSLVQQALERCDRAQIVDDLPPHLLRRHGLPELAESLRRLHRPDGSDDVDCLNVGSTSAHWRLAYGELLELQTELGFLRWYERRKPKAHSYVFDERLRRAMIDILPFTLTAAQKRVVEEIREDLLSPYPMLRLLQGDVGSGKTIVAVLALVMAMESGLQGAFMAPTELLAEQHFRNLERLLRKRYSLALLTSSTEGATGIRGKLASGETQLVVGTHALIQEQTVFDRLGLAVIDEQQRFGVSQRRVLQSKGDQPDLLVMTATPIPRSLALTVYGDLSLSVVDEMPPGRRSPDTRVVSDSQRAKVYRWLRDKVGEGEQAYVVFPLIDESEQLQAESIESLGSRVRRYLGEAASTVLHGRTPADERERIMNRFAAGEIRVLIATTVIEVGVDVPGASIMVVESGERFGLSQLHQLRGRVGRGGGRCWCVVLHGSLSEAADRRLRSFAATTDGFRLAEVDLEIRGPGDLLGTRQSGLPLFRLADLLRDRLWLERAREDARELLAHRADASARPFLDRMRRRASDRYRRFAGG